MYSFSLSPILDTNSLSSSLIPYIFVPSPSYICAMQVDKAAPEGAREKSIVIKGSQEAVERARQLIQEKIGEDRGIGASLICRLVGSLHSQPYLNGMRMVSNVSISHFVGTVVASKRKLLLF